MYNPLEVIKQSKEAVHLVDTTDSNMAAQMENCCSGLYGGHGRGYDGYHTGHVANVVIEATTEVII